jgi:uncharacterized protein with GYD domain
VSQFVVLGRFTEEGVRNIETLPQRREAMRQGIARLGGRVLALFYTLGEYDWVLAAEMPSDAAALTGLLELARSGGSRTVTLKAFTDQEFDAALRGGA